MTETSGDRSEREFLASIVAEHIAIRRARLLSMLVLALAMLVAGIGAAIQAQGTRVDTVLLFSSFSLIMIGIVCAIGALIAWTRINRDVLDAVTARRPATSRAPKSKNGSMGIAIGFIVFGLLLAWMLWSQTPILAVAVFIACALLATLSPIWAGELSSADERFSLILDSDEDLATRFASFTPIWLHDAMSEEARRDSER